MTAMLWPLSTTRKLVGFILKGMDVYKESERNLMRGFENTQNLQLKVLSDVVLEKRSCHQQKALRYIHLWSLMSSVILTKFACKLIKIGLF